MSHTIHPLNRSGGGWVYTHFWGETGSDGKQPYCRRDSAFHMGMSYPDDGCCSWQREPGADDETKLAADREGPATAVFPLKRYRSPPE